MKNSIKKTKESVQVMKNPQTVQSTAKTFPCYHSSV